MKLLCFFNLLVISFNISAQRTQRVNGESVPNDTLKWKADLVSTTRLLDYDWTPEPFTLYVGIDNAYTIVGKNINTTNISSTISSGSISKVEKDKFIIRVSSLQDDILLSVFEENNGKRELINESVFKSKYIPQLKKLNTAPDYEKRNITVEQLGKISVRELLNIPQEMAIRSWTFTADKNGTIISLNGDGERFTETMRSLINSMVSGRMITFDNIKVAVDGQLQNIPSRIWYVKD